MAKCVQQAGTQLIPYEGPAAMAQSKHHAFCLEGHELRGKLLWNTCKTRRLILYLLRRLPGPFELY